MIYKFLEKKEMKNIKGNAVSSMLRVKDKTVEVQTKHTLWGYV